MVGFGGEKVRERSFDGRRTFGYGTEGKGVLGLRFRRSGENGRCHVM